MRVMVIGGTGMLGYHMSLEFVRRGHNVSVTARHKPHFGAEFDGIALHLLDISSASTTDLHGLLSGVDAVIYALGPDDRVEPPAPALAFFRQHLAEQTERVAQVARHSGVKHFVLCGSYFSTFNRLHPEWQLASRHPYIQARHEQAQRVVAVGEAGVMDVCVLEIPYVFGAVPDRVPFWKDILFERVLGQRMVLYPRGGTAVTTVKQVAEAAVGAVMHGEHGMRYVVADQNMDWNTLIAAIQVSAGEKPHVINVPLFLAQLGMNAEQKRLAEHGQESGLNLRYLLPDLIYRHLYLDPAESRAKLGYSTGGVGEAIRETVLAAYPAKASALHSGQP